MHDGHDFEWTNILKPDGVTATSVEFAQLAVLMDIRVELQRLNRLLACPNFTSIPNTLRQIRKNTNRKRTLRIIRKKVA